MHPLAHITYRISIPEAKRKYHCYPLKETTLFEFLETYQITRISYISLSLRTSKSVLFAATYMGEKIKQHPKYNEASMGRRVGAFDINAYTIDPVDQELTKSRIMNEALPLLCEWLREARTAGRNLAHV